MSKKRVFESKLMAEIEARELTHAKEMECALHPPVSLLCKLASIAVHADEALSPDGHQFDLVALRGLIADSEVVAWLSTMQRAAFVPVKRKEVKP